MTNNEFQIFAWDGEVIKDIRKWAAERGEKLIRYEMIRTTINPITGTEFSRKTVGSMPESFWGSLLISPEAGETLQFRILDEQS